MTRCSIWLTLGLLLATPFGLHGQEGSKTDTIDFKVPSESKKYKVMFPKKPASRNETKKIKENDVDIQYEIAEVNNDLTFIVSYSKYPESMKSVNSDKILEAVCKGFGTQDEVKIDPAFKKFKEMNARKVEIQKTTKETGKVTIRILVILQDLQLYQLVAIGKEGRLKDEDVKTFQDSFSVIPK